MEKFSELKQTVQSENVSMSRHLKWLLKWKKNPSINQAEKRYFREISRGWSFFYYLFLKILWKYLLKKSGQLSITELRFHWKMKWNQCLRVLAKWRMETVEYRSDKEQRHWRRPKGCVWKLCTMTSDIWGLNCSRVCQLLLEAGNKN